MYGVDLFVQIENLMPALGLGFLLALIYDLFVFLRLCAGDGKVVCFAADFVYVVLCSVCSFLMILAVNDGVIRFYLVGAEIVAAVIYRCTFSKLLSRFFINTGNKINSYVQTVKISVKKVLKKLKKFKKVSKNP